MPLLLGILAGGACALPVLYALHASLRGRLGLGGLMACCLIPFLVLQLLMLALWRTHPAAVPPFGVSATLSYLATVTIAVLRHSWDG